MKYFIDTHDHAKGSFPKKKLTEAEFIAIYGGFEQACEIHGGLALGAHVNLDLGKAFCFTATHWHFLSPPLSRLRRSLRLLG